MKKILIIVEDPTLAKPLANFLNYFGFPTRIGSTSASRFRLRTSEVIILDAHAKIRRLPLLIQKICNKFPSLRIICLIRRKNSKIKKIIDKKQALFLKEPDLEQIYKIVKRWRQEKARS